MPDLRPEDDEREALPPGPETDEPTADPGPPRLEVAAVAVLLTSVVLAVVPATAQVAPIPWVAGMVMVLLSRRWGPGDKGVALLAFGILGVPFVLLGRDELAAPASVVTGVVLVLVWTAASAWLLRRSRSHREEGRGLRMR
ncbi:hypothetical protein [Oryzobacter terrae]|uniref:hypothetical protein n=1 Tax=Oryzobacter terrae TaxID=1620385 RepID=UPI003672034B